MRQRMVVGNWKMNTVRSEAVALAQAVVAAAEAHPRVKVVVAPPFPWLLPVAEVVKGTRVGLSSQNCHFEKSGAFTGEVSPQMIQDAGCTHAIVGHSERRHGFGETDQFVNRKVKSALAAGLHVFFLIGELLDERESGQTEAVLTRQVTEGLRDVPAEKLPDLAIAYEPVWAIGTGKVATPEQAQEAHAFIRRKVAGLFGEKAAASLPILYGGSVTADNAAGLFQQPDVDGGLVGGASLKADGFAKIIAAAG